MRYPCERQAVEVCQIWSGEGTIVQDEWLTVMVEYDRRTRAITRRKDGAVVAGPTNCTRAPSDRSTDTLYVGRSRFWNDDYFEGEMSKLFVAADIMRDLARACDLDAISGPSVCQTLQSSTWTPDAGTQHYRDQGVRAVRGLNGSSMLVVDGSADNCSQTWREISPWWRVDLGAPRLVVSVRVYGRVDCCQGELEGFEIRVGNWPAWDKNAPCATNISAPRDPRWVEVSCLAEGRYVFVVVPGTNRSLALCEVQVHGLSNQDSNAITGIHPNCTACIPGLPYTMPVLPWALNALGMPCTP